MNRHALTAAACAALLAVALPARAADIPKAALDPYLKIQTALAAD